MKITEVNVDFVKEYLRIDHADDDILLTAMLGAAKSFIQSYLDRKFEDFGAVENIPDEFTVACLAIIAHWYERREIQGNKDTTGELRYVFAGLLDMHRNWK